MMVAVLDSAPKCPSLPRDGSFAEGMKPEASQPEWDPSQLSGGRDEVGRRGVEKAHRPQAKLLGAPLDKGTHSILMAGLKASPS